MSQRGPYAKGVERREAILRTTLTVFSQLGYRGTTVRAVARELDISPSLLRHYFSTREELLTAVIDEWDAETRRHAAGGTYLEVFEKGIRHNASIPGLIHLYMALVIESTDPDHAAQRYIVGRYAYLTRQIIEDITLRQAAGTAPAEIDPERAARVLIAAVEGLQVRWLHEQNFDMAAEFLYLLAQFGVVLDAEPATGADNGPGSSESG
jgi:AcrR family transcriptional regulator